jgi:RHS repeat-associated protein
MRFRPVLASLTTILLWCTLSVHAEDYLVVLDEHSPGLTDAEVMRVGGAVVSRLNGRLQVAMSPQAAEELRQNPSVAYIQGVGASSLETGPASSPRAARNRATTEFVPTSPSTKWASGDYAYDGSGNITAIGTATSAASDGSTNAYLYDSSSRLTKWTLAAGATPRTEQYAFDAYGNMTSVTVGSNTSPIDVNPATNRLNGKTYDASGNLQDVYTDQTAAYDALNMATSTTLLGASTKYIYTADDERIGVLRGDAWTWSIRGADHQVLRQYSSSESSPFTAWLWVEDYVYRDGQLLAAVRQPELGGRRHFHLDHLGTPRLITADDGSQISQHDYTPWGFEISPTCQETNHGYDREDVHVFTGHERDFRTACSDTQVLDYMHARYYNPNVGRFLSVDAMAHRSPSGRPTAWNRYAYAMENPLVRVDPDGLRDIYVMIWNAKAPYVFREVPWVMSAPLS